MHHPTIAIVIALDKIPPLSHLHDPQHLVGLSAFATRAGVPAGVKVLKTTGARNSKLNRGPVNSRTVSDNSLSKVGAGPRSAA
jgi:hypothetical protein